jgi:hypothetical protein
MTTKLFRIIRLSRKLMVIALEGLALLALLGIGFVSYVLFTLAHGPVDLSFMKSDIAASLSGGTSDLQVQIGDVRAVWPNLSGPLLLEIKSLNIWQQGRPLIEISDLSLAIAKAPLLLGRLRPERIILRQPVLTFERTLDHQFRFGLSGPVKTPAQSDLKPEDMSRMVLDTLFGSRRDKLGVFSKVTQLEIRQARIRVADQPLGMTWQLNDVSLFFQDIDVGLYGAVSLKLPQDQYFSLVLTYQRDRDVLSINSRFNNFALPAIAGRITGWEWLRHQRLPMSGTVSLQGGVREPMLDNLRIQASSTSGVLDTLDLLPAALPVRDVYLDLTFDGIEKKWTLPSFIFSVHDIPVRLKGQLDITNTGDYAGGVTLALDEMRLDQLPQFWPDMAKDSPLEKWLLHRLSLGVAHDVTLTLPLKTEHSDGRISLLAMPPEASFKFDKLKVDYRAPLYPVEDAAGSGIYADDVLTITLDKGKIKDLEIADATVAIKDLTKKGQGFADIAARFKGPFATALSYIATDPIKLGDKFPVKPNDVKGVGDFEVTLAFPTIKNLPMDQIDVDVKAKLNDLVLPKLTKGQTLTGGPFDLVVQDGRLSLSGSGQLGGQDLTMALDQPVHPDGEKIKRTIKATVQTNDDLRAAFGANLKFMQGIFPTTLDYTDYADGTETIDLKADLTPGTILFDALRYIKDAGVAGDASVKITTKAGHILRGENLNVTSKGLMIRNGKLQFATVEGVDNLQNADIPSLKLGTSDVVVKYTRTGEKMNIRATGNRLDIGPFLKGTKDPESGPRVQFDAVVAELAFGESETLKQANMSVALNERADLDKLQMNGRAGGQPVGMSYVPNAAGKMTLNLNAENAGAFLAAMGIYKNMVGGKLSLSGAPVGNNNRDVKGRLIIKDFAVVKAPVLAQLLGAASITGLGDQLGNNGIGFTRLESGFSWLRRPNMDVMSFTDGRTSGSSLGLTFDGQYDRRKKEIDLSGTIIPISGLNTFASNIPLVGQIIAGGQGSALFAATYSIKGATDAPRTMVNPLSVLTPGILRRILFEQTTKDPLKNQKPAPRSNNN